MIRVCLIDDDILVRDALALGLEDAGFEVATAPGAAAGLDLVSREPVDIIVTDINMPGANGAQLIADARVRWPEMPIIAISGASAIAGHTLEEVAQARGADAWLLKPFRARQLAELINRVLAERAGKS